jgi:hypothetical protein
MSRDEELQRSWYRTVCLRWYVLESANRLQNRALARYFGRRNELAAELKVEKGSEAAYAES